MHPVLDLQSDRPVAEDDQTLKQGLRQTSAGSLLVHDHRAELLERKLQRWGGSDRERTGAGLGEATDLVVSDENGLLAAEHERDHALCEKGKSMKVSMTGEKARCVLN